MNRFPILIAISALLLNLGLSSASAQQSPSGFVRPAMGDSLRRSATDTSGRRSSTAGQVDDIRLPQVVSDLRLLIAYPEEARKQGIEGHVEVRVLVNRSGRAARTVIDRSSGSEQLDSAATAAIMRALFVPAVVNGRPVLAWVSVPVTFTIPRY